MLSTTMRMRSVMGEAMGHGYDSCDRMGIGSDRIEAAVDRAATELLSEAWQSPFLDSLCHYERLTES